MAELILVAGEPGVGKSFVADTIAAQHEHTVVIRSDVTRKSMFDDPTYSSEESQRVYDKMFISTQTFLAGSVDTVILDATFSRREGRITADVLADYTGADLTIVRVHCADIDKVKDRLEQRDGTSDADFDIHKQIAESFEPIWHDARVDIDNTHSETATEQQIKRKL